MYDKIAIVVQLMHFLEFVMDIPDIPFIIKRELVQIISSDQRIGGN